MGGQHQQHLRRQPRPRQAPRPHPDHRQGRPRTQPAQRGPGPATRRHDRLHRPLRFRQVLPRLRHHLRRRPAPLRRIPLRLRPPVPRPDGEARRRLHRRPLPGRLHRAEVHQPQPPLHRRHHHRDLRLPAPALRRVGRRTAPNAASPIARQTAAADRRPAPRTPREDPLPGPRPRRPRTQGRIRRPLQGTRRQGLLPRPRRRRNHPTHRAPKLGKQFKHTIEVVVDRLVVKDGIRQRLTDSIETALALADGRGWPTSWTWKRPTTNGCAPSRRTWPARTSTRWPSTRSSRGPSPSTTRSAPARPAPASAPAWRSTRT